MHHLSHHRLHAAKGVLDPTRAHPVVSTPRRAGGGRRSGSVDGTPVMRLYRVGVCRSEHVSAFCICPDAHGPSYGGVWGLKSLGF